MNVGFIGWRGMVGSVLLERMLAEGDFEALTPVFFSTSNTGGTGPTIGTTTTKLADAFAIDELKKLDTIVTCQGGDYTKEVYGRLRSEGWKGYWIDAASTLRMEQDSVIILDPVNRSQIDAALSKGQKTFVGGNCTVSLMLLALNGLFKAGLIEWVSSMTYQAASGAGAAQMKELVLQSKALFDDIDITKNLKDISATELERIISERLRAPSLPKDALGFPLAMNLLPYIDKEVDGGMSREEWKGEVETNKILGTETKIAIDGLCVRVSSLRCHSQAFTIKLKKDLPLEEIEEHLAHANEWTKLIANTKETTLSELTPAAVSGTLSIPVGRVKKMKMGPDYLSAFTVGDQLLWGAAEPLRRMLLILRGTL
jgi:aspartate-semialdehyde dehydrogenase